MLCIFSIFTKSHLPGFGVTGYNNWVSEAKVDQVNTQPCAQVLHCEWMWDASYCAEAVATDFDLIHF